MNGLTPPDTPEMRLLAAWRAEFEPDMQWEPERTEWKLWWEDARCGDRVLLAGTLDLLMRSGATNEYGLFDFKRSDPAPKRAGGPPHLLGPHAGEHFHPGFAASPLSEVENSDFGKYAMQLNILAKMLRERYDIDVGDRMYLVQLHRDMDRAHCVRVPQLRQPTDSLFNVEAARLADSIV